MHMYSKEQNLHAFLSRCRPDGYLYDKEAILEYILHQKRDIAKKLKQYEKQKEQHSVCQSEEIYSVLAVVFLR